jgi:hypothetical protein
MAVGRIGSLLRHVPHKMAAQLTATIEQLEADESIEAYLQDVAVMMGEGEQDVGGGEGAMEVVEGGAEFSLTAVATAGGWWWPGC